MGTTDEASGPQPPLQLRPQRKPRRSLQRIAALLVLALPTAFLLFGGQWLAAAGLGPADTDTRIVTGTADLSKIEAEKAETLAREAAAAERRAAAAIAVPAYVPPAAVPVVPGQTVVTLTFDDGFSGQARAAEIMSAAGMDGTFYLNSGLIDEKGSLTLRQAKNMAVAGHEIAGHTFSHPNIATLDIAEAEREICQDRVNLLSLGFQVTNFAYPFASGTAVASLVEGCGYNSARGLGGTLDDTTCIGCPVAESFTPAEPFLLKAPSQVERDWTLQDLQDAVTAADGTGGWVMLTFHGMCPYQCDWIDIDEALFKEFVAWLENRTKTTNTVVRSVQDVVGGPMSSPVAAPQPAVLARGENGIKNADLEQWSGDTPVCWAQAGYGINKAEFGRAPGNQNSTGSSVTVTKHRDGDAKIIPKRDLGTCAPQVAAGHRYSLRLWYSSDVRTQFSVHYRDSSGAWHFWVASPFLDPSTDLTPAEWTTPPVPDGATALSFGLALTSDGTVVTDDYGLYDVEGAPPAPSATPLPTPAALPRYEDGIE